MERDAIGQLSRLGYYDEQAGTAIIAALDWVADGITETELNAIGRVIWLAKNRESAVAVVSMPWVQDGITTAEANAMFDLAWTIKEAPTLAEQMLNMPWIQDDSITDHEATVIDQIYRVIRYAEAPARAERMLQKPWVQDDITETEADALNYLRGIIGRNADAAAALVAMPFLDSVEDRDMLALRSLNNISARDASGFSELMSHPRIEDGITDEETKIVAVLGGRTYSRAPGSAEVLLAETGVYIQERLIELPHTGETLLAVIGVQDPVTKSMDYFEHAVRTIERFMGEPYPIDYLALLYYDNQSNNANNNFTHLLFMGEEDTVNRDSHPGVIAHEAAHWYWSGGDEGYQYRKWITEGSAEFLRIISEHERIGRPLDPVKRPCGFFDSISELEKANPDRYLPSGQTNPPSGCYYSLGQRFFLDLYLTLGDETFQTAFRTLYLRAQQSDPQANPTDGCGRPPFNVCRVEAAFKDGASAEVIAKVDKVLARWYYETSPETVISGLENGEWLEQNKPSLAYQLKALPWVADGVGDSEREAAEDLIRAARWYPGVFNALMKMSWVRDSVVTADEAKAIYGIRGSARHSPLPSERMLQKPWVQDGITRDEGIIIRRLYWLAGRTDEATQQKMVDVAVSIIDMPFLDDVTFAEARSVLSLHYLTSSRYQDSFRTIMSHPKVQDGITDQEAKVIAVLRTAAHYKPEMVPPIAGRTRRDWRRLP